MIWLWMVGVFALGSCAGLLLACWVFTAGVDKAARKRMNERKASHG